jgi:hypothetical protein
MCARTPPAAAARTCWVWQLALERGVLALLHDQDDVPRRQTWLCAARLAAQHNLGAFLHALLHGHIKRLLARHQPLAAAAAAAVTWGGGGAGRSVRGVVLAAAPVTTQARGRARARSAPHMHASARPKHRAPAHTRARPTPRTWLDSRAGAAAVGARLLDLLHHAWADGADGHSHARAMAHVARVALPSPAAGAAARVARHLA